MQSAPSRRPGETIFAALLLLGSLVILHQAYAISGFSSLSGPGVFPMLAAATMVGAMAAVVLKEWRRKTEATTDPPKAARFLTEVTPAVFLIFAGMTIVYMLVLERVGFLISSGVFLFASIWFLDREGPVRALIISAGSLALIYAIFRLVFRVLLP